MPSAADARERPSAHLRLASLREHLAAGRLVLMLDYDGTLAPIAVRPELAHLASATRDVLGAVAQRCLVAVISGRDVDDVAERVGLAEIVYAGCHGLVVRGPGIELTEPLALKAESALASARAELAGELNGIEGLVFEAKAFSYAVHYRLAPEMERRVVDAVARVAAGSDLLALRPGKMVVELVPAGGHKGLAARAIRERLAPEGSFAVYIGDDITDEDAFAAVRDHGLAVIVGSPAHDTIAQARLRDCDDVAELLRALLRPAA
jgi:trehalose-phosphatase